LGGLDDKARLYALKLLSYRGRSVRELQERLKMRGFPENVVSSTINYLQRAGLVNDRALAEDLKRKAITTKLLSQNNARRFMLTRGIPKEIVNSTLILDEKEDRENAKKLIDKRLRLIKNCPPEKIKSRLYNLLLRKGYSFETINAVLKNKIFKED
jgi:regulatory protein